MLSPPCPQLQPRQNYIANSVLASGPKSPSISSCFTLDVHEAPPPYPEVVGCYVLEDPTPPHDFESTPEMAHKYNRLSRPSCSLPLEGMHKCA
ncbi:unnamed protein product [Protopolystoma xenopodis]|uniref:Uncharacterized protein n=1 Tax=Protopolystoma xenopodis TaxID=117903 RepID=A0A448WF22_9PLAT|nr:unnamed protein product [Protopolystoma xenopodis]